MKTSKIFFRKSCYIFAVCSFHRCCVSLLNYQIKCHSTNFLRDFSIQKKKNQEIIFLSLEKIKNT